MAKKTKKQTVHVGIPVDPALKQRLQKLALDDDRKPTELARLLLREGIERREAVQAAGSTAE